MKGEFAMASLLLNSAENAKLNAVLATLEKKYGKDYAYKPEISAFSCKCSGPGQSCVWH